MLCVSKVYYVMLPQYHHMKTTVTSVSEDRVDIGISKNGLEKIIEYNLDDDEKAMFDKSAAAVKETHEALKKLVTL